MREEEEEGEDEGRGEEEGEEEGEEGEIRNTSKIKSDALSDTDKVERTTSLPARIENGP